MSGEWKIEQAVPEPHYWLIAPDGYRVGAYWSRADALRARDAMVAASATANAKRSPQEGSSGVVCQP